MIYEIRHVTRYDYDAPVDASFAEIHQLPGDRDGQRCLERRVEVSPAPEYRGERDDHFGNRAVFVALREPHEQLVVETTSVIDTSGRPPAFAAGDGGDGGVVSEVAWETVRDEQVDGLLVAELRLDSPMVMRSAVLAEYARPSFPPGRSLVEAVTELTHRIHTDFEFDPEATTVDTPIDEVLAVRKGVCQDFAHVEVGCLRSLGLAASYVSGYLETDPPPGQERLTGADRTHAWVTVHTGGGRWSGIDPTNDQVAGDRYVTTAIGRDYGDIPPLKGVIYTDAEESTLTVEVDVVPRHP